MYFVLMSFAAIRIAVSSFSPASLTASGLPRSWASSRRSHASFGNFASIGSSTVSPAPAPGSLIAYSTDPCVPSRTLAFFTYCSGESI